MTTRRGMIGGAAAAAAVGGVCRPVEAAPAGVQCQWLNPSTQSCVAGIQLPAFYQAERQQRSQWCWAASIAMIFSYYGRPVSQTRIVEKLFGGQTNQPAVGPQIVYAVGGAWVDDRGRAFRAAAEVLWDTQYQFSQPWAAQQAIGELIHNRPLIIGAAGHATVLTAIAYRQDVTGQMAVDALTVRDPWPANPNRRQLNFQEAQRVSFLTKVYVV